MTRFEQACSERPTANSAAVGPVEAELFRGNTAANSEKEQRFLPLIPMHRPDEMGENTMAIAFLPSDAGYITGQQLCVDGGGSRAAAFIAEPAA